MGDEGVKHLHESDAYSKYSYYPNRPHCDKGRPTLLTTKLNQVSGLAAFPGGMVGKIFGYNFGKSMSDVTKKGQGSSGAQAALPMTLAVQGLGIGAGLVQSMLSSVLQTVPPLIPPPAWNNQPLPCVPMLTGHNCFGAVLYPITMADFVIADVTDAMMEGYISGFPTTYATKVGKTSDAMYKSCFSAYMSMHCSSIFPRCTTPQSRNEPLPAGGRVPMCVHLCIVPLVMCPGFWIGDVIGQCSMVSVPPMCTQAFFWNLYLLPPQLTSFSEANPYPKSCPKTTDAADDPSLYDEAPMSASPIMKAAATVAKLPSVVF